MGPISASAAGDRPKLGVAVRAARLDGSIAKPRALGDWSLAARGQTEQALTLSGFSPRLRFEPSSRMSVLPCMLIANCRTTGGAMGHPELDVIDELANRGLFRERDLTHRKINIDWLNTAQMMGRIKKQGRGVWSHSRYEPTRYELAQIRLPNLVFWGPTALWLLGAEAQEPASLWIAIANKSRPPRSLDVSTVIIRTRNLERQLTSHRPKGRLITLRVHDRERARADVERADLPRLLQRAADRYRFVVPDDACFLSAALPAVRWRPREDWVTERCIDPTQMR